MGTIERPNDGGTEASAVLVAARDEADRIADTLDALARAFPAAALLSSTLYVVR